MADKQTTLGECYRSVRDAFRAANIANGDFEARLLVAHAADVSEHQLITNANEVLEDAIIEKVHRYKDRRLSGEPVARILGEWQFWGLDFELSPETLVPRADTETLVQAVLDWCDERSLRNEPLRILDIGTGSGAILVALLTELSNANGIANDISEEALEVSMRNASRHGIASRFQLLNGQYGEGATGEFDIIVSNPPYIGRSEESALSDEVLLHDPHLALFEEANGFAAYPAIAKFSTEHLKEGGLLAVEHGYRQQEDVVQCFEAHGLTHISRLKDLGDNPRVVTAQRLPRK